MPDADDQIRTAAQRAELLEPTAEARALQERLERVTGQPSREIVLEESQSIRAIAHEARQRVLDVLFADPGEVFTSTQLAEVTGLSPSAMSYHLRALERWGIVERAEPAGDGRQRPWRAAGTSLRIISPSDDAGRVADEALQSLTLDRNRRGARLLRSMPAEERRHFVGLATAQLWLSEEELDHVAQALERSLVELAEQGWVNREAPGRRRTMALFSLVPSPE